MKDELWQLFIVTKHYQLGKLNVVHLRYCTLY